MDLAWQLHLYLNMNNETQKEIKSLENRIELAYSNIYRAEARNDFALINMLKNIIKDAKKQIELLKGNRQIKTGVL